MSRKPDIGKLIAKGSARKRAEIYIRNIVAKTTGKRILTEREEAELFDTFITPNDVNTYNELLATHKRIARHYLHFLITFYDFERIFYRCKYYFLKELEDREKGDEELNRENREDNLELEDMILINYRLLICNYKAGMRWIKDNKYTIPETIAEFERIYEVLITPENYCYETLIGDKVVTYDLAEIRIKEEEIERDISEIYKEI